MGFYSDQSVVMTESTGGPGDSHQSGMVRQTGMGHIPVPGVTVGTVATSAEILANQRCLQASIWVVTADATGVSISSRAGQCIVVTVGTVGRCHLNQRGMADEIGCIMGSFPNSAMTGSTVTAGSEGLSIGGVGRHQRTIGIVTAGTTVMGIKCGASQRGVGMTVGTGGRCDLNQSGVARGVDTVRCVPTQGVTGLTVAASEEGLVIGVIDRGQSTIDTMAVRTVSQVS